jgi:hypothetical protein
MDCDYNNEYQSKSFDSNDAYLKGKKILENADKKRTAILPDKEHGMTQGYIAIDIEFTGTGENDVIFAYGQADSSLKLRDSCNASSVCLNLFKPKDTSWEAFWIEK